jgi:toxin ParE1/3/4
VSAQKKFSLKLTPQARQDFKNILNYTRKTWGIEQRDRYKKLLDTVLKKLTANPSLGKPREEIKAGYYSYHIGNRGRHYIFYQVIEDSVNVIRILHDSMDIGQNFTASEIQPE